MTAIAIRGATDQRSELGLPEVPETVGPRDANGRFLDIQRPARSTLTGRSGSDTAGSTAVQTVTPFSQNRTGTDRGIPHLHRLTPRTVGPSGAAVSRRYCSEGRLIGPHTCHSWLRVKSPKVHSRHRLRSCIRVCRARTRRGVFHRCAVARRCAVDLVQPVIEIKSLQ